MPKLNRSSDVAANAISHVTWTIVGLGYVGCGSLKARPKAWGIYLSLGHQDLDRVKPSASADNPQKGRFLSKLGLWLRLQPELDKPADGRGLSLSF